MSEVLLGSISIFAGNFAPRGYAFCQGQFLPINQNTALFSLLGTNYGGNGQTTFALPNLSGRVIVGAGNLLGGGSYAIGQAAGSESVTLLNGQMPLHTHSVLSNGSTASATNTSPAAGYPANSGSGRGGGGTPNYATVNDGTLMASNMISLAGGNQPHSNLQPYLVVNYIIALQGIFPSRN